MRIIFITSKLNFETSGASVADLDLKVRSLQKLGCNAKVVTMFSSTNKIPHPLTYEVIEEEVVSKRLLSLQRAAWEVLKKYSKQADIFHIDGHLFLYGAGLYRRAGGLVPTVVHFNRELMCWPENVSTFLTGNQDSLLIRVKKKLRWYIERYIGIPIAHEIDLCTFANPFLQRVYENFGLGGRNRNFMAGDYFDHDSSMLEHGIKEDSYILRNKTNRELAVFYTGRMVPGNGFDTLIAAFSKIENKDKYQLILGGSGPEEESLKEMVKVLGIETHVHFLGWVARNEVLNYFKNADIFVRPKCMRLEFNSNTLREAMAFGLPCIVPEGGALAWGAKNSALTYKDEDPQDLAEKIEQLGDNPNLRNELSKQCFLRLYDDEMYYKKKVVELYNEMEKLFEFSKN